jgi:hypothetical protein
MNKIIALVIIIVSIMAFILAHRWIASQTPVPGDHADIPAVPATPAAVAGTTPPSSAAPFTRPPYRLMPSTTGSGAAVLASQPGSTGLADSTLTFDSILIIAMDPMVDRAIRNQAMNAMRGTDPAAAYDLCASILWNADESVDMRAYATQHLCLIAQSVEAKPSAAAAIETLEAALHDPRLPVDVLREASWGLLEIPHTRYRALRWLEERIRAGEITDHGDTYLRAHSELKAYIDPQVKDRVAEHLRHHRQRPGVSATAAP